MAKRFYDSKVVSARLKELRHEKGITQAKLHDDTGIPLISLKQYEIGRRIPDYRNLIELADYYQVSERYILGIISKEG